MRLPYSNDVRCSPKRTPLLAGLHPGSGGLFLVLMLATAGCARPSVRHHYTLSYPAPEAGGEPSFPHTIQVKTLDINPTYSGVQLVQRQDIHEIRYLRSRRWSGRPAPMITALVRRHLQQSGVVAQVTDRVGMSPPDYVLTGRVDAIEELGAGKERFARLAMTLELFDFKTDAIAWRHAFDARRPVSGKSSRLVVRGLSSLLDSEMDRAVADLARHFAGVPRAEPDAVAIVVAPTEDLQTTGPDPDSPLNAHPQLMGDDAVLPPGKGVLFLPALSSADQEPSVALYQDNKPVAGGQMGKRIVADPGTYEVRFGSGNVAQQISRDVLIKEGRVTPVEPEWAALQVRVVTDHFLPFRGTYELIRMSDREEYGVGFGAEEQLGEQPRVWVLPPGLYKIIQAGGTYRDRTNFATVRLPPGELTNYTLVQDPDLETFLGAGVIDEAKDSDDVDKIWTPQVVIGGDLNFTRGDELGEQDGWDLDVSVFFDGLSKLQAGPHLFVTQLEIEQEHFRPSESERYHSKEDRLYFHNIYTFYLLRWFGPYARLTLDTKLFARHEEFDNPTDVREVDEDGNLVRVHEQVDRVKLGGTFMPIDLREGGGGNFRLLRTVRFDVDVRLGLGAWQVLNNGLLTLDTNANNERQLEPVEDSLLEGVEGTLLVMARVTRWITLATDFDGLMPFKDSTDKLIYTWRNHAILRLSSFSSLNYRLNIERRPGRDEPTQLAHDVQLRFSFTLF